MKRYLTLAAVLVATWLVLPASAQGRFWVLVNGALRYTGQIQGAMGSNAVPTYSAVGAPTTGMYFPAASEITFAVQGNRPADITAAHLSAASDSSIGFSNTAGNATATIDTAFTRVAAGEFGWTAVAFASLGTPANGTFAYCSDCTIANPCAGSGTGALAKRLNGVWVCN